MSKVLRGTVNLHGDYSVEARDFLSGCFENLPENRLSVKDALKHAWITRKRIIKAKKHANDRWFIPSVFHTPEKGVKCDLISPTQQTDFIQEGLLDSAGEAELMKMLELNSVFEQACNFEIYLY